jgi:hypothetical protein
MSRRIGGVSASALSETSSRQATAAESRIHNDREQFLASVDIFLAGATTGGGATTQEP